MATATTAKAVPKVVPQAEWLAARKELLRKENEFTRLRDELSRQRRELPWEKVDKQYVFEGPNGKETLSDLFGGKSQLLVYHFMLGPDWKEGCPSCSYLADHFEGPMIHLPHRDVAFVVVSRAPIDEIEDRIYRISTFVPEIAEPAGFTFNQFLLDADEPLLFHTGIRHLFPAV